MVEGTRRVGTGVGGVGQGGPAPRGVQVEPPVHGTEEDECEAPAALRWKMVTLALPDETGPRDSDIPVAVGGRRRDVLVGEKAPAQGVAHRVGGEEGARSDPCDAPTGTAKVESGRTGTG